MATAIRCFLLGTTIVNLWLIQNVRRNPDPAQPFELVATITASCAVVVAFFGAASETSQRIVLPRPLPTASTSA
jgi:hypothetical protein